jgi:hypothetical protein
VKWSYCECGCHGHEAGVGHMSYWIFYDLKDTFYLHSGHGRYAPLVGQFKSFDEAAEAAQESMKKRY